MAADASRRHVGSRFTRRQVAGAGVAALGLSALAGGSRGLIRGAHAQSEGEPPPATATTSAGPNPWREPPVLMSVDGLLDVEFDARPVPSEGVGKLAYNGTIPVPTLRFRAQRLTRTSSTPRSSSGRPRSGSCAIPARMLIRSTSTWRTSR
jgi:hypothetical protein